MVNLLQSLANKELAAAKCRNYKVEMFRVTFLVLVFILFSFTVNNAGWAGFLLAILYFWHRYVVMMVAKSYFSADEKNSVNICTSDTEDIQN